MRLLSWVISFFKRRQSFDIYSADERLIFTFFNGQRWVRGDPIVLYRRLMDNAPVLTSDIKISQMEAPVTPENKSMQEPINKTARLAHINVCKTVREIFKITAPVDEIDCHGTLSEGALLSLLDDFLSFCDGVKKNSPPSSIFATETLPTGKPSEASGPLTSSSVASGLTAAAVSTNSPTPLPLEQASPSEVSNLETTTTPA